LGSHLCRKLLAEGHRVLCMDNFVSSSERNVHELLENPRFELKHHDVVDPFGELGELEFVFHLASPASPARFLDLAEEIARVNSLGTWNLLEVARNSRARFLLASTSEVYGNPEVHPQPETYWGNVNPVGPRGVYDEAKRFAEAMTMAYHRYHKVETRIVRIFNTYGERMRIEDGRAIPAFMSQALRGENVTVFGDGSQTRSVCYVSDLIDGIFRLMMSDYALPVNIGNPDEVTMLQLANEIVELTGSKSKIVFKELPQDDPKVRQPDITKARELLSWKAKIDRKEGLEATMVYFKRKLGVKA